MRCGIRPRTARSVRVVADVVREPESELRTRDAAYPEIYFRGSSIGSSEPPRPASKATVSASRSLRPSPIVMILRLNSSYVMEAALSLPFLASHFGQSADT